MTAEWPVQPRPDNRARLVVVLAIVLVASLGVLPWRLAMPGRTRGGRTITVERGTLQAAIETSGRLTARRTTSVTSPVGGTVREVEVLRLVAEGLSDAQIAERLALSPHTVHRHVANVRTKLRLPSRAAAVAHAARHGLF